MTLWRKVLPSGVFLPKKNNFLKMVKSVVHFGIKMFLKVSFCKNRTPVNPHFLHFDISNNCEPTTEQTIVLKESHLPGFELGNFAECDTTELRSFSRRKSGKNVLQC